MSSLASRLEELSAYLTSRQRYLENLEAEFKEQQGAIADKDILLEELEYRTNDLAKQVECAEQECARMEQKYEAKIEELKEEDRMLTEKLLESEAKVKNLTDEFELKTSEFEQLKESLEEANQTLKTIPQLVIECKEASLQVTSSFEELAKNIKAVEVHVNESLRDGRKEKRLAQQRQVELEELQRRFDIASQQLVDAEQEISRLKNQCATHDDLENTKNYMFDTEQVTCEFDRGAVELQHMNAVLSDVEVEQTDFTFDDLEGLTEEVLEIDLCKPVKKRRHEEESDDENVREEEEGEKEGEKGESEKEQDEKQEEEEGEKETEESEKDEEEVEGETEKKEEEEDNEAKNKEEDE